MVELALLMAPFRYAQSLFFARSALGSSGMHAVFEEVASRCFTANWLRLPVGTETVPNTSLLLVARAAIVLAICDVVPRQVQLEHEGPRLQAAGLWVSKAQCAP